MKVIPDALTSIEIQELKNLPEAHEAYKTLHSGRSTVYFRAPIPETVKQHLLDSLGLNTFQFETVPFRWIQGDTPSHVDKGQTSFENTYLVYITDGIGSFQIQDEEYPITAGTGFQFPENVEHSVVGTNGTSRLLLGPMSESGFEVGIVAIQADGETDILYLRSIGSGIEYKINSGTWGPTPGTFVPIENINPLPNANVLKVIIETNFQITDAQQYIYCYSDGIQIGDDTTLPDGSLPTIFVNTSTPYEGFVENRTMGPAYTIKIQNLRIESTGSFLSASCGWIGRQEFGRNSSGSIIQNCVVVGDLAIYSGGIVGASAANTGGSLTIKNCRFELLSSGFWDLFAGGIVGANAGDGNGTVIIEDCSSKGTIGINGGGIFGAYAGVNNGICSAERCYSEGDIGALPGAFAGGIYGRYAADTSGSATATTCYSIGNISATGGGIFGANAGSAGGTTSATNCYSIGSIGTNAGGIYGNTYNVATSSALNCYTVGALAVAGVGKIYAGSSTTTPGLNFGEAGSSWNDINSAQYLLFPPTALNPIGTNWVQPNGINTRYLFTGSGYSPYTTALVNNFAQTISAGSTSTQALLVGYTYSILAINSEPPSNYPTIQMSDSTTGIITVDPTTPEATYVLYIYNFINPYATTTFTLTVTGALVPNNGSLTTVQQCCGTTESNITFYQYRPYNEYVEGTVIVNDQVNNTRRKFVSYDIYNKFLTGLAYRR